MIDMKKQGLTTEEKGQLIQELLDKGYSYHKLSKITGIPKATMHHWVSGRCQNQGQTTPEFRFFMYIRNLAFCKDAEMLMKIKKEITRLLEEK